MHVVYARALLGKNMNDRALYELETVLVMQPKDKGAAVVHALMARAHLGQKNADVALDLLNRRGIEVVQTDVGGTRGRKLIFHTDEGTTWLTLI